MNKIYKFALPLMALAMGACNDNPFGLDDVKELGSISTKGMVLLVDNDETVVRAGSTDVGAFVVDFVDKNTTQVVESYTYSQLPEIVALPAGDYTVKAHSPENPTAEWEKPYYLGQQDVTVEAHKIGEVTTVKCHFANVRVSVYFDDDLKNAMSDASVVNVKMGNEGTSLGYTKSETRSGYFAYVEGSNTLVAEFRGTIDGDIHESFKSYTDVAPGKHYKITYRYANADAPTIDGGVEMTGSGITISAFVEVEELGMNFDIDDDPTISGGDRPTEDPLTPPVDPNDPNNPNTPDPTTDAITVELCNGLTWDNNIVTPDTEVVMTAKAAAGFQTFEILIDSNDAIFKGAVADMFHGDTSDLSKPVSLNLSHPVDSEVEDTLLGLHLPVKDDVIGHTEVECNVSEFMPILINFQGTHTFTLQLSDKAGNNYKKTLTLIVK